MEASTARLIPVELKAGETAADDISVQRDSVELEPVTLEMAPAKTSSPQPAKPVAATPTSRTTEPRPLPTKAVMSETNRPKTQATPLRAMDRKRGRSGGRQIKKQKPPAGIYKVGRKLSPERMQVVIESLREVPILSHAASKAGIHRKTLEYWLRCSKAGHNGYDIVWEGIMWRFHEHCASAIGEAEDRIHAAAWDFTMGRMIYTTDKTETVCHGAFADRIRKCIARCSGFSWSGSVPKSLASVGRSTFRKRAAWLSSAHLLRRPQIVRRQASEPESGRPRPGYSGGKSLATSGIF